MSFFHISELSAVVGHYTLKILNAKNEVVALRVGFRRPDHYAMMQVEFDSKELADRMRDYSESLEQWKKDQTKPAPLLVVPAEVFEPRIQFVLAHIATVEGLVSDAGPVTWTALTPEQKRAVLVAGGNAAVWDLFRAMTESAKIPEETKNV